MVEHTSAGLLQCEDQIHLLRICVEVLLQSYVSCKRAHSPGHGVEFTLAFRFDLQVDVSLCGCRMGWEREVKFISASMCKLHAHSQPPNYSNVKIQNQTVEGVEATCYSASLCFCIVRSHRFVQYFDLLLSCDGCIIWFLSCCTQTVRFGPHLGFLYFTPVLWRMPCLPAFSLNYSVFQVRSSS